MQLTQNSLVLVKFGPHPLNPKPPMTIAIGMISHGSIIIGADGQTTRDNVKNLNSIKISLVPVDGVKVMVAEAGNSDNSSRALQCFAAASFEAKVNDYRDIAELGRMAMLKVREELRQNRFGCSPESLDDFIWKHQQQAYLMLCHYYNEMPLIFTVDLASGSAVKRNSSTGDFFACIGTGADLAEYLIRQHSQRDMNFNLAIANLVYVIEEVKKHDTYCGGQTSMGFVTPDNEATQFESDLVESVSHEIGKLNEESRSGRNKKLDEMLLRAIAKFMPKSSTSSASPSSPSPGAA